MPNIRFHDLRHTYATILLMNNHNLKAISEWLGHSSTIITSNVHFDKNKLIINCSNELDDYINRVKPSDIINDNSSSILDDLDTDFMIKKFI